MMQIDNTQFLVKVFEKKPYIPIGYHTGSRTFLPLLAGQKEDAIVEKSTVSVAARIADFLHENGSSLPLWVYQTIRNGFQFLADKTPTERRFATDRWKLLHMETNIKTIQSVKMMFPSIKLLAAMPMLSDFNPSERTSTCLSQSANGTEHPALFLCYREGKEIINLKLNSVTDVQEFLNRVRYYLQVRDIFFDENLDQFPLPVRILPLHFKPDLSKYNGLALELNSKNDTFTIISNHGKTVSPPYSFMDRKQHILKAVLQHHYPTFNFVVENGFIWQTDYQSFLISSISTFNVVRFEYRDFNNSRIEKSIGFVPSRIIDDFKEIISKRRETLFSQILKCFPDLLIKTHPKDKEPFYHKRLILDAPYQCMISYPDDIDERGGSFYVYTIDQNVVRKETNYLNGREGLTALLLERHAERLIQKFNTKYPDFNIQKHQMIRHVPGSSCWRTCRIEGEICIDWINDHRSVRTLRFSPNEFTEEKLRLIYGLQKKSVLTSRLNQKIGGCAFSSEDEKKFQILELSHEFSPTFQLKYLDRTTLCPVTVPLGRNSETAEVQAATHYYTEKDRYIAHLRSQFGKEKVCFYGDHFPVESYGLVLSDEGNTFIYRDLSDTNHGRGVSFKETVTVVKAHVNFRQGYKIIREFLNAHPKEKIFINQVSTDKKALYIQEHESTGDYAIAIYHPSEMHWIINRIKPEKLQTELKEALRHLYIYQEEECIASRYGPSVKVRSQTCLGIDIPPFLPEGNIEGLLELFEKMNFAAKEKADYFDPKDIIDDGCRMSLEEASYRLKKFINTVTIGDPHYFGVPRNHQAYYDKIRAYISQIIVKLRDPAITPLLRNETLIAFVRAASHCGGRWASEVMEQYNALFLRGQKNIGDRIFGFIDELKIGLIRQMISEGNNRGAHEYLAMCKILGNYGIALPGGKEADFADPYEENALIGGNYQDAEAVRKGFMKHFTSLKILDTVCHRLNEEFRETQGKVMGELFEPFREIVNKEIANNPRFAKEKEKLQSIEAEYLVKKAKAKQNQDLIDVAAAERITKRNNMFQGLLFSEFSYFILDKEEMPKLINRKGTLALLLHYDMLSEL